MCGIVGYWSRKRPADARLAAQMAARIQHRGPDSSGVWLDAQQTNRDKAVEIAAGRRFFNQDPNILRFVMENPTDRVTYGDLRMVRAEFEELMQLSIDAGTIKHPVPYETYMDESFARAAQPTAIAL